MRSEYVSTLRTFLDRSGFDWETGKIIIKTSHWPRGIDLDDPVLDKEFVYGGLVYGDMPSYVAEDRDSIYFPLEDTWGVTYPTSVRKNIEDYIEMELDLPYLGRGEIK